MQVATIQLDGIEKSPGSPIGVAHGLTLDEARDLLDWLESNGIDHPDLDIEPAGHFTVSWME